MKFSLALITAIILSSCNDNNSGTGSDNDTTGIIKADTIPTGKSSSPSEFNKGNSSPQGANGGVDSTAAISAVPDKTGADADNRHPELDKMKDTSKKKK